ncbi:hypothetical protein PhCBS80983_g03265 [Powellomyces hirtus]|uniref:Amino acid transporter transmembrane domain-containing protein n=1 Tax=Powellomyces hirtus TaxID=109895 RepID=A0A507E363_9FUNG|nr:hypothetical protein PhCBS80983_g03265 [Powellomyces hirtus]
MASNMDEKKWHHHTNDSERVSSGPQSPGVVSEKYADTVNEEDDEMARKEGKSGIGGAAFNMSKTIVGAGVFGLPAAIHKSGFVTCIVLLIVLAIVVDWTILTLIRTGVMSGVTSYKTLVQKNFGKAGMIFYAAAAFLFAFGGMTAYSVVIGDTIPVIIRAATGFTDDVDIMNGGLLTRFFMDRRVIVALTSFLVLLPASAPKRISKMSWTSFTGLAAVVFIIFVVVIQGNLLPAELKGPRENIFTIIHPAGISSAIGTMSFAYVCHHNQFVIYRSIKNTSVKRYAIVDHLSLGYALVMSLFIGIGGYIAFTSESKGNIIKNLPTNMLIANIARAAFAIDMFFTYPLELYIARDVIREVFHPKVKELSNVWHYSYTIALVVATTSIAVATCNLGFVFDITGGLAASVIAFILPSACYLKTVGGPFALCKIPHILCVMFGFTIMGLTSYTSIKAAFFADEVAGVCPNQYL